MSIPDKRELKANGLEAVRIKSGEFMGAWRFQRPDGRCYAIIGGIDQEQVDAVLRALCTAKHDGYGEAQANIRQALGL